MQRRSNRITLSLIGIIVACIGMYAFWSYATSFQEVVFRFNAAQGYVEIVGTDKQKLYPIDMQPVRLKKGDYAMRNVGKNIKPEARTQAVTGDTTTISIPFSYTDTYLEAMYIKERPAIETALYKQYPLAQTGYTLANAKLYHQGELYGATLTSNDQASDNADILRVLIKKKDNEWQVLSTPPTPVLSAPLYPGINRAILLDINRAK